MRSDSFQFNQISNHQNNVKDIIRCLFIFAVFFLLIIPICLFVYSISSFYTIQNFYLHYFIRLLVPYTSFHLSWWEIGNVTLSTVYI